MAGYSFNRIAVAVNISDDVGNTGDEVVVGVKNDTNHIFRVSFQDGLEDIYLNANDESDGGAIETDKDWNESIDYFIEFRDINYTNNSYDLYVNGFEIANDQPFESSSSGFDELEVHSDTDGSGVERTAYFDNIELGGANHSQPEYTYGLTDGFEDSNKVVEVTPWSGWRSSGSFTIQSKTVFEGSVAANISSSNSREVVRLDTAGEPRPPRIEAHVLTNYRGGNGDDMLLRFDYNSEEVFSVTLDPQDNEFILNIGQKDDGPAVQSGIFWTTGKEYNVTFADISWTSNTFDFYVNGTKAKDDVAFRNDYSGIDEVAVRSDTDHTSGNREFVVDDFQITSGCSANCDFNFGNTVSGTAVDGEGKPLNGATIEISTNPTKSQAGAGFSFSSISDGTYTLTAYGDVDCHANGTKEVTVSGSDLTGQDVTMPLLEECKDHSGGSVDLNDTELPAEVRAKFVRLRTLRPTADRAKGVLLGGLQPNHPRHECEISRRRLGVGRAGCGRVQHQRRYYPHPRGGRSLQVPSHWTARRHERDHRRPNVARQGYHQPVRLRAGRQRQWRARGRRSHAGHQRNPANIPGDNDGDGVIENPPPIEQPAFEEPESESYLQTGTFLFDGTRCVGLRYYDPSQNTTELHYSFNVEGTQYEDTITFDDPVGYYEQCIEEANVGPTFNSTPTEPPTGDVEFEFEKDGEVFNGWSDTARAAHRRC
ncbi:MAG: carboxypeptidase-like regulatory domain-containing protein [Halobacteriales archaeon]|nr:carboxypeptidase-like regulatory domain-containing protein [Halobacteriales archaeon]